MLTGRRDKLTPRARFWRLVLDDISCTYLYAALAACFVLTLAGVMYAHA